MIDPAPDPLPTERRSPRWDVYRDAEGNAVTLTEDQGRAVLHAIRVWREVCQAEGVEPSIPSKSRLLGRMLHDGRPPLDEKPPYYMAACGYHLVEPDLGHWYLGTGPIPVRITPDGLAHVVEPHRFPGADHA